MEETGWVIDQKDKALFDGYDLKLEVCTDPERRSIKLLAEKKGEDTVHLNDYEFDYKETIQDMIDLDIVPQFLAGMSSVLYTDKITGEENVVFASDISEIIGDITWNELALYSSFSELNNEYEGFEFSNPYI